MTSCNENGMTRRALLAGGAALAVAAALPASRMWAQTPARYRRYNVASAEGQAMLISYEQAVRALLQLPPSDPRNWYSPSSTVTCLVPPIFLRKSLKNQKGVPWRPLDPGAKLKPMP